MRIFLTLSLVFTMGLIADHHEEAKYKYEPEANKAEYYIGTFNKGKDMEDLVETSNNVARVIVKDELIKILCLNLMRPY